MPSPQWLQQSHARVRFDTGPVGARRAAARGDGVVIVDLLCFSTTVVTAAAHGIAIRPCVSEDEALALGFPLAQIATKREQTTPARPYSLSPLSFVGLASALPIALPSPNGARCVLAAAKARGMAIGALVNVGAVIGWAAEWLGSDPDGALTVIASGEQDPDEPGALRFALEDSLAAGAIISGLVTSRSAEAEACALTFEAVRDDLELLIWDSASGRELAARGFTDDVAAASTLDRFDCVPRLLPSGLLAP